MFASMELVNTNSLVRQDVISNINPYGSLIVHFYAFLQQSISADGSAVT